MRCPCSSGEKFSHCCKKIHDDIFLAKTAESLMRSRYSAFVVGNIAYLKQSLSREKWSVFDQRAAEQWSLSSKWDRLEILSLGSADHFDVVEFKAHFQVSGQVHVHHEISRFRQENGHWVYFDGEYPREI